MLTKQKRFTDEQDAAAKEFCATPCTEPYETTRVDITKGHDGLSAFFSKDSSNKAWSTKAYREFGELPSEGYYVDDVICFLRANAFGYGVSATACTMMARDGSANMCRGGDDGARGYNAIIRLEQFNDKYFNITYAPLEQTIDAISRYMQQHEPEGFAQSKNFFAALEKNMQERALLRTYWRKGTLNRLIIKRKLGWKGLFNLLRCLPMPIYARLLAWYRKIIK